MSRPPENIADNFFRYFSATIADTSDVKQKVYRIRFRVYCEEFGYEDKTVFPDGIERDEYDDQSTHCLIVHRASQRPAACVRMVPVVGTDPAALLPFEKNCAESLDRDYLNKLDLDREQMCEISRLAVDGSFRRRPTENADPIGHPKELSFSAEERRSFPMLAVAAYLAATAITDTTNFNNVFAIMAPFLPRLLARSGIHFARAGRDIDYHGVRAPYFIHTEAALKTMAPELLSFYNAMRAQLYAEAAQPLAAVRSG